MAGEHCGCEKQMCDDEGIDHVIPYPGCPGLPSRADVLREAARAVCQFCRAEQSAEKDNGAYWHGGTFCHASAIHALLEKEGSK